MLDLAGNVLTDDVCIKLRLLHLEDVDLDVFLEEVLQLLFEFVDISATFTNDDTRTSSTNSDGNQLQSTLDDDARNAGFLQTLVKVLTDLFVLNEVVTEVLATEPI